MPFKKGKPKTGGRSKGVENKISQDIKGAIKELLERNASQMDKWLDRVAKRSPYKALIIMYQFSEFATPKLSRIEADVTTKGESLNPDLSQLTADELKLLDKLTKGTPGKG
jgi:hypothetical protein